MRGPIKKNRLIREVWPRWGSLLLLFILFYQQLVTTCVLAISDDDNHSASLPETSTTSYGINSKAPTSGATLARPSLPPLDAIKQFDGAQDRQTPTTISANDDDGGPPPASSNEKHANTVNNNSGEESLPSAKLIQQDQYADPLEQARKSLIASQYRLKALKGIASGRQLAAQLVSNYSQPFNHAHQPRPSGSSSSSPPPSSSHHHHYQQQQQQHHYQHQYQQSDQQSQHFQHARALGSLATPLPDAPASYSYLLGTSGTGQQRAMGIHPSGLAETRAGSNLLLDVDPVPSHSSAPSVAYHGHNHDMDGAEGGAVLDNGAAAAATSGQYTPPLVHTGHGQAARMYPQATSSLGAPTHQRLRVAPSAAATDFGSPYYVAAPSHSSAMATFGDGYYGSSPGAIEYNSYARDSSPHYANSGGLARNYSSDNQLDFTSSSNFGPPMFADYLGGLSGPPAAMTARSRWSWPWMDVSNLGGHFGTGGVNPMSTAATFKKHHHHHHHHLSAQHKEHDHHHDDEHEHLMPKWEHGISIGEIACIAIAVVLGIIILGSPFFLLFLMLFNGGNLFGATQMGLLAPAAVQAQPAAAAGRRRRRRSVPDGQPIGAGGGGDSIGANGKPARAGSGKSGSPAPPTDLAGMGEYLFERLSPYMDPEKLMRSFERIMDVKDDIEKIMAKMGQQQQHNHQPDSGDDKQHHQHVEMRRRRKK